MSSDTQPARKFVIPRIEDNEHGWGPLSLPQQFTDVPYAPFSKSEKLSKAADWTANNRGYNNYPRYNQNAAISTAFSYHHTEDDENFTLVDNAPKQKARTTTRGRYTQNRRGGDRNARNTRSDRNKTTQKRTGQAARGRQRRQGWNSGRRYGYGETKRTFEASVEVKESWKLVDQFDISSISDRLYNVSEPDEISTYGELEYYDRTYDNITAKNEKPLERIERAFYKVTTSDDPVIRQLANTDGAGTVFATDAILSVLMACPRAVYPWDIIVQRVGGKLFFDKRDNLDFLTVNETANEPPTDEKDLNSMQNLAQEATTINRNFSQQVLIKGGDTFGFDKPNPFQTEGEDVASVGYRYRRWDLGDGIDLVVRCEVDGVKLVENQEKFVMIRALNEFDPKTTGWRQKLESQRGAVLATELKNNSNKLARWTSQALLAGADHLVLGYVSRLNPKDPYNHGIVGTQTYNPNEFAQQINLNIKKAWGILKSVIDKCMHLEQGKYLLMKDPNKAEIRLYSIPADSFEDDDDEGDEEEDDDVPVDDIDDDEAATDNADD